MLVRSDHGMNDFVDKNAIRPLFVGLADKCVSDKTGMVTMIMPTIGLTAPSGIRERLVLAERFHVHTIITCPPTGTGSTSVRTRTSTKASSSYVDQPV